MDLLLIYILKGVALSPSPTPEFHCVTDIAKEVLRRCTDEDGKPGNKGYTVSFDYQFVEDFRERQPLSHCSGRSGYVLHVLPKNSILRTFNFNYGLLTRVLPAPFLA